MRYPPSMLHIRHASHHFEGVARVGRFARQFSDSLPLIEGGGKRARNSDVCTVRLADQSFQLPGSSTDSVQQRLNSATSYLGADPTWYSAHQNGELTDDITLTERCGCHRLCVQRAKHLATVASRLPLTKCRRQLTGVEKSFAGGLRATRKHGLTSVSTKNAVAPLLQVLNATIFSSLHVQWKSVQVIQHRSIPPHCDPMDGGLAYMCTPTGPPTFLVHEGVNGEVYKHSTVNQWIAFDPCAEHSVEVEGDAFALSVVVFTPKRSTRSEFDAILVELGFPGSELLGHESCACSTSPAGADADARSTVQQHDGDPEVDPMVIISHPGVDPSTGLPSSRRCPSWTSLLTDTQCALRKSALVVYLLQTAQPDVTLWHEITEVSEQTADDILNARCYFHQCADRERAALIWNGVAERELGPPGSRSRAAFRKWLRQREGTGWSMANDNFVEDDVMTRVWRLQSYHTYSEFYAAAESRLPLTQVTDTESDDCLVLSSAPATPVSADCEDDLDLLSLVRLTHDTIGQLQTSPSPSQTAAHHSQRESAVFDPMCFPPVRSLRSIDLSPTQCLPNLSGGGVEDDPDYPQTLKRVLSIRPKKLSGPQIKLLLRGVPGLYGKVKKLSSEEQVTAAVIKAARDLGLLAKEESEERSATAPASSEGTAQQRSRSAALPRKDRNAENRASSASSGSRVRFEDATNKGSKDKDADKDKDKDKRRDKPANPPSDAPDGDTSPFFALHSEEWNVPIVKELHMAQTGVAVAASQAHAEKIVQACSGTRVAAGFIYSSPLADVDTIEPVSFLARRSEGDTLSLVHAFLHQLGPTTLPVVHKPCTTHIKRSTTMSTSIMIIDFADRWTPECNTEDFKSVRSFLTQAARGTSTQQKLTLVDVFHLTQSDCGAAIKIRVMEEQVAAWLQRGTGLKFFPRPVGPLLDAYVTFFDKQLQSYEEALQHYANLDGYMGLTVKAGQTWGAIFKKDRADAAATSLGKAPGQTYRISGLPLDMPAQELSSMLAETKWVGVHVVEGSRRIFRGTATWLLKSVSAPVVTSLRMSHSDTHLVYAVQIEPNKSKIEPKQDKAPPWMNWAQRLKQPLAPPPASQWKKSEQPPESGASSSKSPRSRLRRKDASSERRSEQEEEDE
eukprot:1224454-Amphidinium_carterae.1